jgi:hypothetical protein
LNYLYVLYLYYYYHITVIILESKRKKEKKVGRLWEAREATPQSISIEKQIKKFGGKPPVPP